MSKDNHYKPLHEKGERGKIDFRRVISRYLHYWYWFAISLVLALLIAYGYNRYTTRVYSATAQIKILSKNENSLDLQQMGGGSSMFGSNDNKLKNQVAIIRSRRILDSVVKNAKLQTLFYREGNILTIEKWHDDLPVRIVWSSGSGNSNSPTFSIAFKTDTDYVLKSEGDDDFSKQGSLNDTITAKGLKFTVELNPSYEKDYKINGLRFLFKHVSRESAINHLSSHLSIDQTIENSDVLDLTYTGPNRTKNEIVLNTLVREFYLADLRDKELVSQHSAKFIDKRINLIEQDLDTVEGSLVSYKQQSGLINIASMTGQQTGREAEASKNRYDILNQQTIARDFIEELKNREKYELLPANFGLESGSVNSLISSYNEAVSIRKDLLVSSTEKNPLVKNAEQKLDRIKQNILSSLSNYMQSLNQSLKSFTSRKQSASSRIHQLPENERMLRSIERQQRIKEELYLFLLKKREEIGLEYAMISPSVRTVDDAYSAPGTIAPNTRMTYTFALLIGFFLPFSILYLKFLFYNRIDTSEDIREVLPNIPMIGEIPQVQKSTDKIVKQNDQSSLAEAFRILRTNLNFFMPKEKEEGGQVVFVTSTSKAEGKTFVSFNMAQTLALTDNKILIIGADLRNPKTHTFYNLDKNVAGLSDYLVDSSIGLETIVHRDLGEIENVDLIVAGEIPPNPAELLMRDRFGELIAKAKEIYDYIIVDTAPTKVVTDSLLISQYADLTIYVVRSGVTDKRLLEHIGEMRESEKLKHVGILLNGMSYKSGYGYNYEYGYSESPSSPWWMFWKS